MDRLSKTPKEVNNGKNPSLEQNQRLTEFRREHGINVYERQRREQQQDLRDKARVDYDNPKTPRLEGGEITSSDLQDALSDLYRLNGGEQAISHKVKKDIFALIKRHENGESVLETLQSWQRGGKPYHKEFADNVLADIKEQNT